MQRELLFAIWLGCFCTSAPGPALVDVWIDKTEDVLPMVKPGHGLSQMIE